MKTFKQLREDLNTKKLDVVLPGSPVRDVGL